jgi:gamma-glutamyltranspeptidase / glutathione hydrolase
MVGPGGLESLTQTYYGSPRTLMINIVVVALLLLGFAGRATALSADEVGTQTMRPVIRGRQAAVSSMRSQATEAARRILEAGGNAFDAAVAGQAVLGLTDFADNGLGSDAVVLVYVAREKKVYSVNAEPRAPKLATIEWYEKNNGGKIPESDGLLSGGLPGVVDAWYVLLDHWGTMSFEQVLEPAINLAENGFPLGESSAEDIASTKKILKYPTTVKIYLPDGKLPKPGDVFRNSDLARTLRKLVEAEQTAKAKGRHEALKAARDRFYKGDVARDLASFSEANGGLFRYDDFADYMAEVETPVSINYRGYRIYKNPSASQGPTELIALNLLEGFDLKGLGHNAPDFLHTSVEAIKLAMADREKYLGDQDFITIPYDGLLSKEYARERRRLIDPQKASLELRPGSPEKFVKNTSANNRSLRPVLSGTAQHDGDTSYIAVVDKDRNMVSFEPSLHSAFGTGVVMGSTGLILNCRGDYYSLVKGEANALEPGKRPRSTLQSTLVLKENQPYAILGSPGGDDQVMRTMQTLINLVDFGMNIQQAIEAPRWSTRSFPASPFPHTMYPGDMAVEARIAEATRQDLMARGHKLRVTPAWSMGSNAGIVVDPITGILSAGADPRVEAYAWAW